MKYFLFLCYLNVVMLSCKQDKPNQFSNGLKEGFWLEYLSENRSIEVAPSQAKVIRKLNYSKGYPVGQIIETDLLQQSRYEFQLTSGPYKQKSIRPQDQFIGLKIFLEYPDSTKINNWIYYDSKGEIDFEKLFITGYSDISEDDRFDKDYFLKTFNGSTYDIIFKHLENNPEEYDKVVPVVLKACKRFKSDPYKYLTLVCELTKQQVLNLD